jgi:hypothetical protein
LLTLRGNQIAELLPVTVTVSHALDTEPSATVTALTSAIVETNRSVGSLLLLTLRGDEIAELAAATVLVAVALHTEPRPTMTALTGAVLEADPAVGCLVFAPPGDQAAVQAVSAVAIARTFGTAVWTRATAIDTRFGAVLNVIQT